MSEPVAGDHLVSTRGYYAHHGLCIGDGQVIHYAGLSNGWQRGCVEKVDLSVFKNGEGVSIRTYKTRRFTPEQSVVRASGRLREDFYCLLANNCEHFVCWCIDGDHQSSQVVNGSHAASTLVVGVGGCSAIAGISGAGVVAGLSGPGVMSGLASIGSVVGGGAIVGLGVVSAIPSAASALVLNYTLLRDNQGLDGDERHARLVGRIAANVSAVSGTVGGIVAVGAMGAVAGFSGAGIASGLAAIGSATGAGAVLSTVGVGGGMMIGGVLVAVAGPAVIATVAGYGAYRGAKWLGRAGWLDMKRLTDRTRRMAGRKLPC